MRMRLKLADFFVPKLLIVILKVTRMHSSRMRTVRCSGRRVGRGSAPVHAGIHTPPPREQNDRHACENITSPQLRCGR